MKSKTRPIENGTVLFNTIERIQFWLTPHNQIFLVSEKSGLQVYPANADEEVESLPDKVSAELHRLQNKQQEIRKEWEQEDKDSPDAWNFSDDVGQFQPNGTNAAMAAKGFLHRGFRGNIE